MDTRKVIEEAKKHGVDMSWLQQPQQPQGQGLGGLLQSLVGSKAKPQTAMADNMFNIIRQQAPQISSPVPIGTPTQASKQYQEGMGYTRERDEIADQRYAQEWEYKKQQDAIANQLASMRASGSGASPRPQQQYMDSIYTKLMDGETLTPTEMSVIGMKGESGIDIREDANYYKSMIDDLRKQSVSQGSLSPFGGGLDPSLATRTQTQVTIDYIRNLEEQGVNPQVVDELLIFYGLPTGKSGSPQQETSNMNFDPNWRNALLQNLSKSGR